MVASWKKKFSVRWILLTAFIVVLVFVALSGQANAQDCTFKAYQQGGTTYGQLDGCGYGPGHEIHADIVDSQGIHHPDVSYDTTVQGWYFRDFGPNGSITVSGFVSGQQIGQPVTFNYGSEPIQPTAAPQQGPITIVVTATQLPSPQIIVVPNGDQNPQPTAVATIALADLKPSEAAINTGNANFRNGPGIEYSSWGMLTFGTKGTYLGQANSKDGGLWYQLSVNNQKGWVNARLVMVGSHQVKWLDTNGNEVSTPNVSAQQTVPAMTGSIELVAGAPVYAEASVTSVEVAHVGSHPMTIVPSAKSADGQWYQVQIGDKLYWVPAVYAKAATATPVVSVPADCKNTMVPALVIGEIGVSTKSGGPLNLREEAKQTSTSHGHVQNGGTFTVLAGPVCPGDGFNWWKVEVGGESYWLAGGDPTTVFVEPQGETKMKKLPNNGTPKGG